MRCAPWRSRASRRSKRDAALWTASFSCPRGKLFCHRSFGRVFYTTSLARSPSLSRRTALRANASLSVFFFFFCFFAPPASAASQNGAALRQGLVCVHPLLSCVLH